jgi:hypothetical protein
VYAKNLFKYSNVTILTTQYVYTKEREASRVLKKETSSQRKMGNNVFGMSNGEIVVYLILPLVGFVCICFIYCCCKNAKELKNQQKEDQEKENEENIKRSWHLAGDRNDLVSFNAQLEIEANNRGTTRDILEDFYNTWHAKSEEKDLMYEDTVRQVLRETERDTELPTTLSLLKQTIEDARDIHDDYLEHARS